MNTPTILVHSAMLMPRVAAWDIAGWRGPAREPRILGPDRLSAGLDKDLAASVEVLVCAGEPLSNALIDRLPCLALVACFATGYGGIDLAHLRSRGVALTSAGGVNAHDVADHAVALLLAWWHGIVTADAQVRRGDWRGGGEAVVPRRSVRGRRAGIVGLGRIGSAVATRLAAHEMEIRWWGPRAKPGAGYARADTLADLARWCDVLVLTGRSGPGSDGQIDSAILTALGSEGVLVNVSRGSLVDEDALIAALHAGTLAGAALDVFEHEPINFARWAGVPNVVLTPHLAGFTKEGGRDMTRQLEENVRRHFAGEPLLTPVDDVV